MAIITSIVLVAPVIGPLSGAALMHFVHWEGAVRYYCGDGTAGVVRPAAGDAGNGSTRRDAVQRGERTARFSSCVSQPRFFSTGAATLSLSYIPMMSWVAVSPVILIDAGG
nr:sugar transport protein [Salmonella sp. NCTC 7297]